jgi:hypothetical protein
VEKVFEGSNSMKILSIGNFSYGWDGSICDEEHIAGALEELGHTVFRQQRDEPHAWNSLDKYDFILMAQWDGYLETDIEDLKRYLHAPVVYWAFDYQADGQEWHERLIAESDLYLSKRIADSKYPNWQWLSQDFSPKFLFPMHPMPGTDIDVLFTGSYLPWATERNAIIGEVAQKYNLVIHSVNDWPEAYGLDVRPPIMDEGLPELYARAKVILSIDHTLEAGYWSDRNAQIICCGRRPLFRYIPLSETTFHDDVDYFYNVDDCLKKIDARLSDPLGMEKIATDTSQYKVKARVKDLLNIVRSL